MNDSRKVAMVGAGAWGRNLIRVFYQLGTLAAICEVSRAAMHSLPRKYRNVEKYLSLKGILSSEKIRGIVVATPAVTHYQFAREAILAGKDVFVEKPMALNLIEAQDLVELALREKRILMVGHVLEYHPAVLVIEKMIKNGELGNLCYLYSNHLNLGKLRRDENVLWSFAPHDIAVMLRLVGEMPRAVCAIGSSAVQKNVYDVTMTHLSFQSGICAHVFVSWLNPFKEQKFVVVGAKGMIEFNGVEGKLVLYKYDVIRQKTVPYLRETRGQILSYSKEEPLLLECKAFIEAVETRKAPITNGESALKVMKILDAAQRSIRFNGKQIEL